MNRNNRPVEIDHIDPRWKEGRDYQLVCGLDCLANYREEDWKRNSAKSNRFLPWRWSRDEIGVVPEEHGDLAQFLVNGEWVLLEFLSKEWYEASKRTHGAPALRHRRNDSKVVKKQWETLRKNPELIHLRAEKMKQSFLDQGLVVGSNLVERYRCKITGKESNVAGIVRIQKKRGIDPIPENRIRLQ
jgi:hypothetical protein